MKNAMEEIRNAHKILVGKACETRFLRTLVRTWKDNTMINLEGNMMVGLDSFGWGYWPLADKEWTFSFHKKWGMTRWMNVSSWKNLLHGLKLV